MANHWDMTDDLLDIDNRVYRLEDRIRELDRGLDSVGEELDRVRADLGMIGSPTVEDLVSSDPGRELSDDEFAQSLGDEPEWLRDSTEDEYGSWQALTDAVSELGEQIANLERLLGAFELV